MVFELGRKEVFAYLQSPGTWKHLNIGLLVSALQEIGCHLKSSQKFWDRYSSHDLNTKHSTTGHTFPFQIPDLSGIRIVTIKQITSIKELISK